MKDKVIYTCITGGYDDLKQPKTIYDDYDYICFSNSIFSSQVGVWSIKPIFYDAVDNTRIARYVKHNPHVVIPEYKYSIWIDSNVQIVDNYLKDRVELMISEQSLMATIQHPNKNCIYEDAREVLKLAREHFFPIYNEVKFLLSESYPPNNGLFETNILFRKHNNLTIVDFSELWWGMICKYSNRDQLCQCYLAWKNNLKIDYLLPQGENTTNSPHFKRIEHKQISTLRRIRRKWLCMRNMTLLYLLFPKIK